MKQISTYIKITTIVTVVVALTCLTCKSTVEMRRNIVTYQNKNLVYVFNNIKFLDEEIKDDKLVPESLEPKEEIRDNAKSNIVVEPIVTIPPPLPPIIETPDTVNPDDNILELFTGVMSGYGPDCYGCTSNKTSSGYDISNGNIYFADKIYGNIRIVSGDKKYPFGSIVKISNSQVSDETFFAIVLDRGSGIGLDKNVQFDLLYSSEKEAETFGLSKNATFEIVRLGY